MQIIPVRTRLFRQGENLKDFIIEHVPTLCSGDLLIVTSKIVALAESRVLPPGFDKRLVVESDAEEFVETPWCLLTRKGSDWCANAGADESNSDGSLILLPERPKMSATILRDELSRYFANNQMAVLLTDTRMVPLRHGTMGMALAWSGINPMKDYVGTPDLFGRLFKMTKANIAHALAAAAVLVMGEGAESVPLVIIRGSGIPIEPNSDGEVGDLAILPKDDLYRYLFVAESAPGVDNTFIS